MSKFYLVARETQLESVLAAALGERLRQLRLEHDMSQEKLALAAGINRNHYQTIESGERVPGTPSNPTVSTLYAIAGVYGISLADLLGDLFPAKHRTS